MREIKFRAFDVNTGKMIYFDFNNIFGYEGELQGVILPDQQTVLNYNSGYGNNGINNDLDIMQYVGILDKNSVEIYEGDILKCPDFYETPEGTTVTYSNSKVYFENSTYYFGVSPMYEESEWITEECEVIGSIYQNQEIEIEE